jgi:hypothetical protein
MAILKTSDIVRNPLYGAPVVQSTIGACWKETGDQKHRRFNDHPHSVQKHLAG